MRTAKNKLRTSILSRSIAAESSNVQIATRTASEDRCESTTPQEVPMKKEVKELYDASMAIYQMISLSSNDEKITRLRKALKALEKDLKQNKD